MAPASPAAPHRRRTKIVCTLGPATDTVEQICALIEEGLDVARLNFSHGSHEEHGRRIACIKEARKRTGKQIAILQDTKGIKIRMGYVEGYADDNKGAIIELVEGTTLQYVCDNAACTSSGPGAKRSTPTRIYIDYDQLAAQVHIGQRILLDDGLVGTTITAIDAQTITATVDNTGRITSRRSVNIPGAKLALESLTPQDQADILFGISQGIDFLALSFCRRLDDVVKARVFLDQNGGQHIQIISKIENQEGVENLDEILTMSDGVMVARGDMAVELPYHQVPGIQKRMIRHALRKGKICITATQMLHSMIQEPVPTRAEVSDVFNAVEDATTAIMLSGETASGKHPREAVRVMHNVATASETVSHYDRIERQASHHVSASLAHAAVDLARDLHASCIVAYSESGNTARRLAGLRTTIPLLLLSDNERVIRQCNLLWGLDPIHVPRTNTAEELFTTALATADARLQLVDGDSIVVLAGTSVGMAGGTNTIRIMTKGDVILRGTGMNALQVTGTTRLCTDLAALRAIQPGEIAIVPSIQPAHLQHLERAAAVLVASTEYDQHAIAQLQRRIPVIVDIHGVQRAPDGTRVCVLAGKHVVLRVM
jgi:pyruvate kinase